MKITQLSINRYKSITEPFILDEPGKLHFFIGSNNVGKTNILDAIHQIFFENDIRYHDPETNISITFTIQNGNIIVRQIDNKRTFIFNGRIIDKIKAETYLKKHIIRLCATPEINFMQLLNDYKFFSNQYKQEFKLFWDALFEIIPQIKINKKFFDSMVHIEEIEYHFSRIGAGFQNAFTILLYLFHPEYTILLLEEPEVHLHPALIKKLLTIFEKRNIDDQIFVTTHSPLFINPENIHRLFRVTKDQKSTRIHSPRLVGKHLNYDRLSQELNADNTEMFFADIVLLVEGSSDHILLRGLINRFYQGNKDIKVIQLYGKSNVDIYIDLLEIFDIPYRVLFDRDALYDTGIKCIQRVIKADFSNTEDNLIILLKQNNIFILPNGSIECNYPRRYQRQHKHKTQSALYAVPRISKKEYSSALMKNIREIIESL